MAKTTLEEVCRLITDGDHGSADYVDADESGVTFVLSEAVESGRVRSEACRKISLAHAKTLGRSKLLTGDVLVTKTGVYFGKSAVVDEALSGANTIAHVGLLRPRSDIDPYFLSTFLNCKYGQAQLRRRGIKATRPEIKLLEFDGICVPVASEKVVGGVRSALSSASNCWLDSNKHQVGAENVLAVVLGLADWRPPQPLSYTCHASQALGAGRLDAEYFAPRVSELLARLRAGGRTIADVAPARRLRFVPSGTGEFRYIEIGNVGGDGTASVELVAMLEAPSRATQLVRAGDVLTSTVRPIRRLSAIVLPEQDGAVASSGFVVLQPRAVAAEVLMTYLRLPLVCEVMDLHTSASLYPAISESDLLNLPFPQIGQTDSETITKCVREAHACRRRARELLAAAQHAVEIAIEQNEAAALAYLDGFGVES